MPQSRRVTVAGLIFFEVTVDADDFGVMPGREHFARSMAVGLGGAINTASVLRALGVPVTVAFPAGRGIADQAIHAAVEALDLATVTWNAHDDPALSIVLRYPNDRAFVTAADFATLAACPELSSADHIHVPGLEEAHALRPRLEEARRRGATVSVSGSWAPERLAALSSDKPPWTLLIMNESEARAAAGSVDAALSDITQVPDVVVTLDNRGAVGRVDGVRFATTARGVEVEDHTGAGDAFAAGFIAARLANKDGADAAGLGAEAAARQLMVAGGVARRADAFADLREMR